MRRRDDVGGFAGAQQRAAPQRAEAVGGGALGQLGRLLAAGVVEGDRLLALEAPVVVVGGLAVAGQVDAWQSAPEMGGRIARPSGQPTDERCLRSPRNPIPTRGPDGRTWTVSAYIAELVGTFLLVLFIALIVSVYARAGISTPEFAVIGLLHAFLLMMLIQTLGGTSGAHFNPAVTLGLLTVRKIRPDEAAMYIVMQVVGAIAGAAVCKLILNELRGRRRTSATRRSSPLLHGKTAARRAVRAGRHVRAGVGDHGGRGQPARHAPTGRAS